MTTNKRLRTTDTNAEDSTNVEEKTIPAPLPAPKIQPLTIDGEMPQKRYYRSRAHCNPLSHNDNFEYPTHPSLMDWNPHYPALSQPHPDILDIGCGFGGLTIALGKLLPDKNILGLEIRTKVNEYVRLRIVALRKQHPGQYENCSVMRTNAMKYLPCHFPAQSLEKLFFCFPDPHFKKKNFPRRIVNCKLLSEYAYLLKPGGMLYCITDVESLHEWHVEKCDAHPMFRKLSAEEMEKDACVAAMIVETEEGKKVARSGADKYYVVYERLREEVALEMVEEKGFWD